MSDQLYSDRAIRILTIVDNYSRESLALQVGVHLTGEDVVAVLNGLLQTRGIPHSLRTDNGTEFTSWMLDQWAYWNGVQLDFIRRASPPTTRSWRRSTAASGRKASTSTGSCR